MSSRRKMHIYSHSQLETMAPISGKCGETDSYETNKFFPQFFALKMKKKAKIWWFSQPSLPATSNEIIWPRELGGWNWRTIAVQFPPFLASLLGAKVLTPDICGAHWSVQPLTSSIGQWKQPTASYHHA